MEGGGRTSCAASSAQGRARRSCAREAVQRAGIRAREGCGRQRRSGCLVAAGVAPRRPRMGDRLAVDLPALDRTALVRIQVPQPVAAAAGQTDISVFFPPIAVDQRMTADIGVVADGGTTPARRAISSDRPAKSL